MDAQQQLQEKDQATRGQEQEQEGRPTYLDLSLLRGTRDTARGGLFFAILALLLAVFFFTLTRGTLNTLQESTENLSVRVSELGQTLTDRVGALEGRLVEVEGRGGAVQREMIAARLEELTAMTRFLGTQVGETEQEKLAEVQRMLKEVQESLRQASP